MLATPIVKPTEQAANLRKFKRVESSSVIEIRKITKDNQLDKTIKAKMIDYSSRGCCLIIKTPFSPQIKDIYQLNMFNIIVREAQIKYVNVLENKLFKVGLQYITSKESILHDNMINRREKSIT